MDNWDAIFNELQSIVASNEGKQQKMEKLEQKRKALQAKLQKHLENRMQAVQSGEARCTRSMTLLIQQHEQSLKQQIHNIDDLLARLSVDCNDDMQLGGGSKRKPRKATKPKTKKPAKPTKTTTSK